MSWTAVASLPEALNAPAAGATGGKLYVWGQNLDADTIKGYVYNPGTNTWSAVASCPAGSPGGWSGGYVLAVGSYLYLINAQGASWLNGAEFLRYNPTTDVWTDLTTSSSMESTRIGIGAAVVGSTIAWVSAPSSNGPPAVQLYDPGTNTWATRGPDNTVITYCVGEVVTAVGTDVYVIGGVDSSFNLLGATQKFDTVAGTWSSRTVDPTPTYRGCLLSGVLPGSIPVAGGYDTAGDVITTVELYDPTGNSWSTGPALPGERAFAGGAVVGSDFYLVGGYDNTHPNGQQTVYRSPADFSSGSTPVAVSGSSAHTRGASATVAIRDYLTGASSRTHGASASIAAPVTFTAPVDLGWERNRRRRHATATIDVDDAVIAPDSGHHMIQTAALHITGGPTLDGNGQPDAASWTFTTERGVWGRYRIRVGGRDVTKVRGALTLIGQESDTEPFGDDTCQLVFPMIGPFEALGVGDLDWLAGADDDEHIPVVIERVDEDGNRTIRFEGDTAGLDDTYDGRSDALQVRVTGVIKTLDERITKPRMTSDPIDCGQLIHDIVAYEAKYGWNGHAPAIEDAGIDTADRGGYGDPLATVTIQNLLAGMQTGEGTHWTLTNRRHRGMQLIVKDKETVNFTLWCGQQGVTHQLTRDLTAGIRAIFGEGMDHGTQFWRNTQYPNAENDPPAYPLPDGTFFNPGDGHSGLAPFSDELRTRGYDLASRDTYLAGDEDEIRDFQGDAGISVDGVVGGQTWNAAFTTGIDAHALDAYIRPLAVASTAEPFLYNARGGIIGDNPAYTGASRRERKEDFGTLSKRAAKKSAKRELEVVRHADWAGTVTLTNIDPPQMCALDIRSGMNFLFKGHRGVDRLLHVAKADRQPGMTAGQDRVVTLTSSERGDDYVTLAARLQRKKDVVDQSGRTRAPRRSGKISPDFAPWDSESGAGRLKPRAQTAGLWNMYEIPSGERGTITHVRLVASTPCLIAAAVFNWEMNPNALAAFPGLDDPSAGALDGSDPWQGNAKALTVRPTYADQPWMAWATGGPGAMQGYWPNDPAPDATVTGVLDDSQEWPFHSRNGTWLFLLVWTDRNCRISGDPDYDYRALFPGADT